MQVQTTRQHVYTYHRQTGEIVSGWESDDAYVWNFEPLKAFSAMPDLDMFILCLTEQCNLRCAYCCYSGEYLNNRSHSMQSMQSKDIDAIYHFIQNTTTKRPLHIAFYGGEPLTQYELLQHSIEEAKSLWPDQVVFSINTNATLLTKDKIDWLMEQRVQFQISVDGTSAYHDRNRVYPSGKGSFMKMYNALTYIANGHPDYMPNVALLMTVPDFHSMAAMAEEWHNDPVLKNIAPSRITGLAPNFAKGVMKREWEDLKYLYLSLLDIYEQHPDWLVLKALFDECLVYWKKRPIIDAGKAVPMATCMPLNNKLYIDAKGNIGVCEKMSDNYRIGNVKDGINWKIANDMVSRYYQKRQYRCAHCPAIRVCNLCLTAVEFNEEQWDVLCHNERLYARLDMLLFCEMAERGMVS